MNCPIVIPTYKNRPGNLVQKLDQFKNRSVFVFVYENDYENYKEYDCYENVEFVKLNVDWRSIQKKRRFIQEWFVKRPEIVRYIMIDDDCYSGRFSQNNKTKPITLLELLNLLEEYHLKYGHRTVSGVEFNNLAFAHATKIVKQNPFYQCFLFENSWVINHPECRFRYLQNVAEDVVIWFDCVQNNQPFDCFQNLYLITNKCDSLASSNVNLIKNQINALRIMKHQCKIVMSSSWHCWIVGIGKPCPFYYEIKNVLDNLMPHWEYLQTNYDDSTYIKSYNEINNIVVSKQKPVSALGDFLYER